MRSNNENKKLVRESVLVKIERQNIRKLNAKEYEEIRRFENEDAEISEEDIA